MKSGNTFLTRMVCMPDFLDSQSMSGRTPASTMSQKAKRDTLSEVANANLRIQNAGWINAPAIRKVVRNWRYFCCS